MQGKETVRGRNSVLFTIRDSDLISSKYCDVQIKIPSRSRVIK